MQYKPYIPQALGELLDHLGYMTFSAPRFMDKTGYFPKDNIETAFFSLNEGLKVVREEIGEQRYATLKAMSDKIRALFESDPDDINGNTHDGQRLIYEMDDILLDIAKRAAAK